MPELPEVEVLRRSLAPLVGERFESIEVRDSRLREPVDEGALRDLVGGRVEALGRRAKYLLIHLERDDWDVGRTLVVHLGMSGRFTLVAGDAPEEPHEHVVIRLASGRKLRLRDPRRFGLVFAALTDGLERDPHFGHLGIEPMSEAFSGAGLRSAAERRRGPVKGFLMDATVVVGLGNIYATEALFRAGIHPARSVARISGRRWTRLATAIRDVLRDAIAEGGTTLNDFSDGEGRSGYFQVSLAVYGRESEPCPRCGRNLKRIVQSNRSTFYCPGCQR
jgi:formamidopyrimidine-DNA glycosylase